MMYYSAYKNEIDQFIPKKPGHPEDACDEGSPECGTMPLCAWQEILRRVLDDSPRWRKKIR